MTSKTYISRTTYKLVSGEVRVHEATRTYTVSGAYVIPEETKAEIMRKHREGVSAARIGRDVGLTAGRVLRVIKKAGCEQIVERG